ncbi:hypothetical protein AnigIFM56816_000140 [Aspergillus niger]|nr:hypothetical protein AnigIFM56816_000140 [Aspergillus niger]
MSLTEAIGQSAQRVIEQIIEQIVLEPTGPATQSEQDINPETLDKDATEAVWDQFINYIPDDKDTNDDHVSNRGPPGDGDHVACGVA